MRNWERKVAKEWLIFLCCVFCAFLLIEAINITIYMREMSGYDEYENTEYPKLVKEYELKIQNEVNTKLSGWQPEKVKATELQNDPFPLRSFYLEGDYGPYHTSLNIVRVFKKNNLKYSHWSDHDLAIRLPKDINLLFFYPRHRDKPIFPEFTVPPRWSEWYDVTLTMFFFYISVLLIRSVIWSIKKVRKVNNAD